VSMCGSVQHCQGSHCFGCSERPTTGNCHHHDGTVTCHAFINKSTSPGSPHAKGNNTCCTHVLAEVPRSRQEVPQPAKQAETLNIMQHGSSAQSTGSAFAQQSLCSPTHRLQLLLLLQRQQLQNAAQANKHRWHKSQFINLSEHKCYRADLCSVRSCLRCRRVFRDADGTQAALGCMYQQCVGDGAHRSKCTCM
jgi:hypothetical protein